MDAGVSGRGAETVYRDKEGRRVEGPEALAAAAEAEKPKHEKPAWGGGIAQARVAALAGFLGLGLGQAAAQAPALAAARAAKPEHEEPAWGAALRRRARLSGRALARRQAAAQAAVLAAARAEMLMHEPQACARSNAPVWQPACRLRHDAGAERGKCSGIWCILLCTSAWTRAVTGCAEPALPSDA